MSWRKRLIWTGVALLVAAALAYGFWPRAVAVDTSTVTRGPMREAIEQEGKTRVRDRYVVASPVTGRLERPGWKVGDRVRKGQELLRIDPAASALLDPRNRAQARARVHQAHASLGRARAQLQAAQAEQDLATRELERTRRLHARDKASDAALDQAENRSALAKARVRSGEFGVKVARFQLEGARAALKGGQAPGHPLVLKAPVTGRILKVQEENRAPVTPGKPLLTLGDTTSLEVVVDVLSSDAVRIDPGTAVEFTGWGGGRTLHGQVSRVEPSGYTKVSALGVEEQRVDVIAAITSPRQAWRALGHGYRVDARFVLWSAEDVLQVPDSALFRHGEQWAAFVVEDGRIHRRTVEVGHRSGLKAQIRDGLQQGQTVVTHPANTLRPGMRVRPRGGQAD